MKEVIRAAMHNIDVITERHDAQHESYLASAQALSTLKLAHARELKLARKMMAAPRTSRPMTVFLKSTAKCQGSTLKLPF